ncbi:cell division protein FtsL [Curvibacter sp. CHRR-16]|uniref:cell division protein FtsL n=1 Tax=Curvibacter sp. CHRR-16 TaxID=2835872 RepID=UPI001BD978D6|nr:cell division protein FtsL [Curvibacter sp. CHRR-16]MBT0569972.1 cell division protein FtsL [Curvibacter sp. CHRR-16]
MIRLNLVLMVAVLLSALYLVSVQYESRSTFVALEKAHAEARRLELERQQLVVAKRAQATPAKVEKIATDKLKMRQANPAITTYAHYTPVPSPAEASDKGAP